MKQVLLVAFMSFMTLIISVNAYSNDYNPKVIYGEDNRVDVLKTDVLMYLELSKSTAAMINKNNIFTDANGKQRVSVQTMVDRGICASERFSSQPTAASCSGSLVGEDLIVTAGHCITSMSDCRKYKWVFDYKMSENDEFINRFDDTQVFSCAEIIERKQSIWNGKDDYALIRLDRKVEGRRVLEYRREGKITDTEDIVVIGHPTGLPTKIADGANVRDNSFEKYFQANLDTYGGNSGSAVFNANTGTIEGILVRGATDFVSSPTDSCRVSNICENDGCSGEDITRITNISALKNI